MKNILFLINNLNRGGAERVFTNQINYLCNKNKAGFIFLGLLFNSKKEDNYFNELKLPKEKIVNFEFKKFIDLKFYLKVKDFIKENKIDIIYSTTDVSNIVARLLKIFTPHASVFIRESGTGYRPDISKKPKFKILKLKIVDIFLNFFVKKVIVVSREMRKLSLNYQKIHKNRIVVIENGVVIKDDFKKVRERNIEKKNNQEIKILAVGSMNYRERNFEYLLEALNYIVNKCHQQNFKLVFVGKGKLMIEYKKYVKEKRLEKYVEFLGFLNSDDLDNQYRQADIFVLTSTSEGCPNAILEAISFGLPIISTRAGSASMMVQSGYNGYLVDFNNSEQIAVNILNLAKDQDLKYQMAMNSYQKAIEIYSIDKKTKELLKTLEINNSKN